MSIRLSQRRRPIRRMIRLLNVPRARDLVKRIEGYLAGDDRVLDIGCGSCIISEILRARGLDITPVDVRNFSLVDAITPLIYDGRVLPFPDDRFDVGLLITMLHHIKDPESVLQEARRVCKRLVIVEDVYKNRIHKYVTFVADSIANGEYFGHPHSNKSDAEWRAVFERLSLRVLHAAYQQSSVVFSHATYHLER